MTDPTFFESSSGLHNKNVLGSNNVIPSLYDTLGVIFLGVTTLVLLAELHKALELNRKLLGLGKEKGCCDACDCCQGEKADEGQEGG